MDQRELYFDPAEGYRLAFEDGQAFLWTALPGVIVNFPAASGLGKMIADVQPAVNFVFPNADGTFTSQQLPLLVDCPVQWQGGGGVTTTFPIRPSVVTNGVSDGSGDECLIILASRCIDSWWQQGFKPGPAMNPPSLRMHNLSDGYVLVGVRSHPREFAVDMENAALITDDGQTFFKLNPTTKAIALQAAGGISLNGVAIDGEGSVTTPENLAVGNGFTGSFTTPTGQTVDVVSGIIVNIF